MPRVLSVCHSDVVYELFGRDPWHLLVHHMLPVQNLDICSICPSQGGLSFLRRCCQWGGQEGAALVQLLRTEGTQLSMRIQVRIWARSDWQGGQEGLLWIFGCLGFLKKFYFIWPEACLFKSHFCNSNGSQMLMKLSGDSLSKCQKYCAEWC